MRHKSRDAEPRQPCAVSQNQAAAMLDQGASTTMRSNLTSRKDGAAWQERLVASVARLGGTTNGDLRPGCHLQGLVQGGPGARPRTLGSARHSGRRDDRRGQDGKRCFAGRTFLGHRSSDVNRKGTVIGWREALSIPSSVLTCAPVPSLVGAPGGPRRWGGSTARPAWLPDAAWATSRPHLPQRLRGQAEGGQPGGDPGPSPCAQGGVPAAGRAGGPRASRHQPYDRWEA